MSDFSDKTIIVTGGGSCIGHATVELLVASVVNVAVADINDEAGEAVVAASGGKAAYFRCDTAREEAEKVRKSVGEGERGTVRGELGGGRHSKKTKKSN